MTTLSWDEVLGEMPAWAKRCHLPTKKRLTTEMVMIKRHKIELVQILGQLMQQYNQRMSEEATP